jgi:hypothetical protein
MRAWWHDVEDDRAWAPAGAARWSLTIAWAVVVAAIAWGLILASTDGADGQERGPALVVEGDPLTTLLAFTVEPGFWRIGYNSHVWTAWVEPDSVVWSVPPEIWSDVDFVWDAGDSTAVIMVLLECEPCTSVSFEDPPGPEVEE